MLYPERAIKLFQKAKELGVPKIESITNGFWGKDKTRAQSLAAQLKEAGVNEVLISVDAFHLPHIPLDYPRNVALASLAAGIDRVAWNVAILENVDAPNKYDKQTKEILQILSPLNIKVHFNKVLPKGRARKNFQDFFPRQPLKGGCPEKETALVNPNCLSLDPFGWASICEDLAIGNAKKMPLSKLLIEYDWMLFPVIKTLVEKGPSGLLDLPESKGFDFQQEKYIDKCHLCCELRKFVCKIYPETYVSANDV